MEKGNAKELLQRYLNGTCTPEEKALVESFYNLHHPNTQSLNEQELEKELGHLEKTLPLPGRGRIYKRIMAAAAAVLMIGFTGWWMYRTNTHKPSAAEQPLAFSSNNVIVPGSNKAVLTLANGKKISLTDAGTGNIAHETGISIEKTADGQMLYRITDAAPATAVIYNTIETPVGGQYQVLLPDGTKVWLNAKSALRFPVHFNDTERRVEISGEAYLEVAHDKTKPFRVVNPGQVVEVLGTHFNVNTYDNEAAMKTTLLEGAVKIATNGNTALLKPGQQSNVVNGNIRTLDEVNVEDVVAWKNNKIQFTDLDIHSVMRMLERWYNIDVSYTGNEINTTFGGSVSRSKDIDVVLKLLEATGDVHFKIEGRRVTVMP
ncbi:hypothetical protein A4H97_25265 [Niastella yeongjuensis]|uniref:Iron dicitrate transport regulator FecR n=1 Tax=Niastella yeongjuensis TaxID=354355 RepID=A0A1V9F2H1_9BACT|nr:FecR domain-containing protein [Niastella yeongjuensis]OQP52633.1 hypothetical protein A4H97_25265 [Niastella yeongjuensis]SEP33340.1 FecR family protein [Niastella yeongjuensis]